MDYNFSVHKNCTRHGTGVLKKLTKPILWAANEALVARVPFFRHSTTKEYRKLKRVKQRFQVLLLSCS